MTTTDEALQPDPAWGRSTGHTRVRAVPPREGSDEVLDRLLVAERIYRYAWGYDERDEELLGACFVDAGVWEGSIMGSTAVGPFEGRAAVVEFLTGFWPEQSDQRRHVFTNVVIDEIDATSATAHAYLLLTSASSSSMSPQTTGPYRFALVKDAGVWRFERLSAGFDAPF